MNTPESPLATELVDAANALYGAHPGRRALHARGFGLSGSFTASGEASDLTLADHFVSGTTTVLARFSGGSGDPDAPDRTLTSRGLAVRFETAAGNHDILAVDSPVFLTPTPELFAEFLRLSVPARLDELVEWLGTHPVVAANAMARRSAPLPSSFATTTYHAIHAFELVGLHEHRFVRFRWEPAESGAGLDLAAAGTLPAHYLYEELEARLDRESPVGFDLLAQLAASDDVVTDPSVAWPDDREVIPIGRLELTAKADVEGRIFDPAHVVPGVACGPDPVLAVRSAAYGVSYERRTG